MPLHAGYEPAGFHLLHAHPRCALKSVDIGPSPFGRVGDTAISLLDIRTFARDEELLSHLSEAGTTKFGVEQVKYGGHDHPRCLTVRNCVEIFLSRVGPVRSRAAPNKHQGGLVDSLADAKKERSQSCKRVKTVMLNHSALLFHDDFVDQLKSAPCGQEIQPQREKNLPLAASGIGRNADRHAMATRPMASSVKARAAPNDHHAL